MRRPPHVAVLIETSGEYGRGLLRGVARYVCEHGPWSIYFHPQDLDQFPPPGLARWHGDGILSRVNTRKAAKAVLGTKLPTVELRGALADLGLPFVGVNNRLVAKLAAEHLLERGLRRFGFCGTPRRENRFQDQRCDYFKQFIEEAGYPCRIFPAKRYRRGAAEWEAEQNRIAQWLCDLPKPCGVMTCHDERGQQVLDAALRGSVKVPDEVAVVSANNDEHLCALSNPPLSSIDVNPIQIGYEGAALLDRMMTGAAPPKEAREIAPLGLVVRQSSDIVAVDDAVVSAALRFIRENACKGTNVEQVLAEVAVSRSTLEHRFKASLGRTPKTEMLRVQLERAKELLVQTKLPLNVVAAHAGFGSVQYFIDVFGRKVGITPGGYRGRFVASR